MLESRYRKLLRLINLIIIAVLLALSSGCSCENELPLTVMSITEGNVTVFRAKADSYLQVEIGMSLGEGDIIRTENNSSAVITFFEGSTIELQAGTQVEIESLSLSKSGNTKILLKQQIGETISRVNKLADPKSRYEIETVSATAAVRGSIMVVNVTSSGVTSVGNEEGNISIIAQGVEVQIPVGSHSTAAPGQPPAEPVPGIRAETVTTPVYADPAGDLFDKDGTSISGEGYLDIVSSQISLTAGVYTVRIVLNEHCPEQTAESGTFIEWDIFMDTDKNKNTGTYWPLMSNDIGYDYMARLELQDGEYGQRMLETSTGAWSDIESIVAIYNYETTGNIIELYFPASTIGSPDSFNWVIAVRKYLSGDPPNQPSISDKSPNEGQNIFP